MLRQGGEQVLYGTTLALAATVTAWSTRTGQPVTGILHDTLA
jgi:hypothetical protein